MAGEKADDWFILRTAGRFTLSLTHSLKEDGFEVWTPVRMQTIRVPRMNVRREVKLPMLPSFIFAKAHHLVDLIELADMRVKPRSGRSEDQMPHRDFSVFRFMDTIPMVSDGELEPLRTMELRRLPTKVKPKFGAGAKVRVKSGSFEGLKGRVERCRSGYALVIFTDWKRPAKIPTWLLSEDEALSPPRSLDEAA
jgi:hypothetical protein